MNVNPNREYITAIAIMNGIIQLIEPDGNIGFYRQRGIQTLSERTIRNDIKMARLNPNWKTYPELPKNWSISFEDEEIMGKALATYPTVLKIKRDNRNKNR